MANSHPKGIELKEVSPLGEELSLFDRPNEVEKGRILEAHRLEPILQQQLSQRMTPSHYDGRKVYFLEDKQIPSVGVFDEILVVLLLVMDVHVRYGYSSVERDLRTFSDIGAWVQVPRCMAWLDYDEHVDSLGTMDNEVGVTSPESTTQTLSLFEEYTPPVTYPEEVEKTLGTPIEVEPLNETKLEEVGLNCNHNTPLSSREIPSFDRPEPQPLLNSPSLDVSLRDIIGPEPPIKPHSPDSSRMKVVDYLTTQTPPSPHMTNSHPKGVYSYYNQMFDDDWGLEFKEVSPLGEELSLFDRPNEVEKGRILEAHRLEPILQQQLSQRMAPSHHDGRKAHSLEEKKIPSVGVFDEVFRILKTFGRITRDLGLFGEETDYGPTPTSIKNVSTVAGDGVTNTT
ncbi:hypothetical protein Tco_1370942 [Tanacetum coccineum]